MRSRAINVIVADPHTASRNLLQQQLEDAGFSVRATATAEEVLVLCEMELPDVLIVDVHLDGMDGYEVCERVRHETKDFDVTIIIMSDVVDEMTRVYLGQMVDFAGGDFFVAKPCDTHWLIRLLDTFREGRSRSDTSKTVPFTASLR